MSSLSTLPKGDSAWLLRKSIQRIMQQVSVLETNIGSSTTGNSIDKQVIFNDNGVLRGDSGLQFNPTTDTLQAGLLIVPGNTQLATVGTLYVGTILNPKLKVDVAGTGETTIASATITGNLTVDTSTLKVDSANNRVGVLNAAPNDTFTIASDNYLSFQTASTGFNSGRAARIGAISAGSGNGYLVFETYQGGSGGAERYRIASDGVATWSNVGGGSGTAMTLDSNGLGVGGAPLSGFRLNVNNGDFRVSDVQNEDGVEIGWSDGGGSGFVQVYNRTTSVFKDLVLNNAATITASGNVGIAVTPSSWSLGKALNVNSLDGAVLWGYSGAAVFGNNFRFSGGYLYETTAAASRYSQSSGSHQWFTAPSGTAGNAITFTQAMTLDASGNLLVGTTTTSGNAGGLKLSNVSGNRGEITFSNNSGSADYVARFNYGSTPTLVGNITVSSGGTSFVTTSDYRLKQDVQPLVGGLARINALKPSTYKWKADDSNGEGFIAHELADVVPLAVTGEKDAVNEDGSIKPQGVDLSRVVPILVAAIQELTARVQTLETR